MIAIFIEHQGQITAEHVRRSTSSQRINAIIDFVAAVTRDSASAASQTAQMRVHVLP
jgi:hypothetical protein